MYKIRLATHNDIFKIQNIMLLAHDYVTKESWYYIDDTQSTEWLNNHIESKGFTLVIENNTEIIGFLVVHFPGTDNDNLGLHLYHTVEELNKVAHMETTAVLPYHKGHQLMQKMLLEAEKILELQHPGKFKHLMATVHPDNMPSLKSFEKVGYNIIDRTENKYGQDLPRFTVRKELNSPRS